jgi:hypothetical protein
MDALHRYVSREHDRDWGRHFHKLFARRYGFRCELNTFNAIDVRVDCYFVVPDTSMPSFVQDSYPFPHHHVGSLILLLGSLYSLLYAYFNLS